MDIVSFSPVEWDALRQRHQQLAERLASLDRVLFVEPAKNLFSLFWEPQKVSVGQTFLSDVEQEQTRKSVLPILGKRWMSGARRIRENLFVYAPPPSLPLRSVFRPINRLAYGALGCSVGRIARRLGFQDMVLWVGYPNVVDAIGGVSSVTVCYDCADRHSESHKAVGRKNLEAMEEELCRRADVVFAVSEGLCRLTERYSRNVLLLPNGSDPNVCESAQKLPRDMEGIKGPILGFVGALNHRVDVDLIQYVASARREWSLVLVGPCDKDIGRKLEGIENVHLFGRRDYEEIHSYIGAFDVCLLPFKVNEYVVCSDPVKTYDYLSLGKPIVSVDFPHARRFEGLIEIGEDYEGFVGCIEDVFCHKDEGLKVERRKVAGENSWDNRVDIIRDILATY